MAGVSGASSPKGVSKSPKTAPAKPTKKAPPASSAWELDAPAKKLLKEVSTPPKELDELRVSSSFPLGALEKIAPKTSAGQVFRLDGGFLDALRVQVRRIRFKGGDPGYQIEMKIAGPSRASFEKRLTQKGADAQIFKFYHAQITEKAGKVVHEHTGETQELPTYFSSHADELGSEPNMARSLSGTAWQLDFIPEEGPIALRGSLRILLRGKDGACNAGLLDLIQKVGLHEAFAPPTRNSVERYKLMKRLWHQRPSEAAKLAKKPLDTLNLDTVSQALKKLGVSEPRLKGLRYEEVAPGHFTVVDPALQAELTDAGLRYAYSTVAKPEHVHAILLHGQKATLTRWSEGALISGLSSMDDVGSGGAQGVFSRLVTDGAHGDSWNGRRYRIVLKPELLSRLDIWGWSGDQFGQSWDLGPKNFGSALVGSLKSKHSAYSEDNEIVSPVGNGPQYIACVTCASESDRKELLKYLKAKAYKPPKGKTLENFVRIEPKIRANLLSGKAPAVDDDDED